MASLGDGLSCRDPRAQNEPFTYTVGSVGQLVPAPPAAGRVCRVVQTAHPKKAAKYCGLEAWAEVTLLRRTSVFSLPGHKNRRTRGFHLIAQMIHLQLGVIVYSNILLGLN